MSEGDIRQSLRACFDPEWGLDVEEAGLVEAVSLQLDRDAPGAGIAGVPPRFRVELAMLRPEGPAADDRVAMLDAQIRNCLAGLAQVSAVQLAWHDGWTQARLSGEARLKLGLGNPLFPILNRELK